MEKLGQWLKWKFYKHTFNWLTRLNNIHLFILVYMYKIKIELRER